MVLRQQQPVLGLSQTQQPGAKQRRTLQIERLRGGFLGVPERLRFPLRCR